VSDLPNCINSLRLARGQVLKGDFGDKLAVRFYRQTPLTAKYLVVAYKEVGPLDGFVVTAYLARRVATWRERLWKR